MGSKEGKEKVSAGQWIYFAMGIESNPILSEANRHAITIFIPTRLLIRINRML